ncbi:unnamed protein product [Acidocella sp. C78]|nr:relaxase domain-containing protein [Acidocella sp. C78]CAG4927881.1 unnamed protein product [Acidocella sp. C78]
MAERGERSKTPIGYVDFTFSADKTISLAWAFAPTEAERNQLAQAHKDAVAATMAEIEQVIGQARKGKGARKAPSRAASGGSPLTTIPPAPPSKSPARQRTAARKPRSSP